MLRAHGWQVLFLINRDTRFSADKTPYHPWVDAIWWAGLDDARRPPAFVFRLSVDCLVAGTGITGLRDTQLDRYPTAVAGDTTCGLPLCPLVVLARLSRLFRWRPEDHRCAAATALAADAVVRAAVMLLI